MGGDGGARLVEGGQEDGKPLARRAQHVGARHTRVVETQGNGRSRPVAHLVFFWSGGETIGPLLQHQRRDRAFGIVDLTPLAEEQDPVGHIPIGDEDLRAVDDDVLTVLSEAGFHARGIGARIRFGDGERADAALCNGGQKTLFLLF